MVLSDIVTRTLPCARERLGPARLVFCSFRRSVGDLRRLRNPYFIRSGAPGGIRTRPTASKVPTRSWRLWRD